MHSDAIAMHSDAKQIKAMQAIHSDAIAMHSDAIAMHSDAKQITAMHSDA
jgi:hypothetical protein